MNKSYYDKDKKIASSIILLSFAVLICGIWLIWFLCKDRFDTENYENRYFAQLPTFSLEGYETYTKDLESYINDKLPFRNEFIKLNSYIDFYLFHKSSNPDVAIGKDDWLFLSEEQSGDPIGCYKGSNVFTDDELEEVLVNCVNMQKELEAQGIEFMIFIAPDKERVYSDMMPDRYGAPAENYQVKQIVDYLRANSDIPVIYPYDELIKAKEGADYTLYYKTDTHWNYAGGYVGAREFLKAFGIEIPEINSDGICVSPEYDYSGDLSAKLNMVDELMSTDKEYVVYGYDNREYETLQDDFLGAIEYQSQGANPRRLYVIRDSFFSGMLPFVGPQFDNSYYRHIGTYTYDDLKAYQPDVVVYECVERFAYLLKTFTLENGKGF